MDGTPRDKLSAASMIKGMDDSNIAVEQFRDKQARLDQGTPTEITDALSLGDAAMSLAAQLDALTSPRKVEAIEPKQIDNDIRTD